jgi:multisite-specific tRNA:(cytosine-C5)-methyltransferase
MPVFGNKRPRLDGEAAGFRDIGPSEDTDSPMTHDNTPDDDIGTAAPTKTRDNCALKDRESRKRLVKVQDSEGSFKENPYTFVSPDDPILQSCM